MSGPIGFVPLAKLLGVAEEFPPVRNERERAGQPREEARKGSYPADIIVGDIFAHTELMAAPVFEAANERTRPNLKVQDGCDNRCSFCVIPYVRGQSRSLPEERVLAEVRTLVAAGYREVVISGINLGRWGRDFSHQPSGFSGQVTLASGDARLVNLIRAILSKHRLRNCESVRSSPWIGAMN